MLTAAQWLISYVASYVYIQDKPLGQCYFGRCAWLIAIATYLAVLLMMHDSRPGRIFFLDEVSTLTFF